MREPLVSRGEVDRLLLCRRGAWLKVAIFWLLFDIRLTLFGYPPIAGPQLIWATASRDQSSMRSSSMRFAPHSPASQGAWAEPTTLAPRSAYPEVLTPVITSLPRSARAPGFQKRLAAQSSCQAQQA